MVVTHVPSCCAVALLRSGPLNVFLQALVWTRLEALALCQ